MCRSARANITRSRLKLDKRFASGLQFRTFYVWSRLENNRANSGHAEAAAVQNPIDTQTGEWCTCR